MEKRPTESETYFRELETISCREDDSLIPSFSDLPTKKKRNEQRWSTKFLMVAYVPLILLYALLAYRYFHFPSVHPTYAIDLNLFPSLQRTWPVQTEKKVYKLRVIDSNFTGKPTPIIDQAWHDLLEGTVFRASKEDLDFYNVTSLPLADGSGYATEIFMTHELHCLKLIRKWKYKEHYYVQQLQDQGPELAELDRHVDHCIETLRQGIMCRGDVSLATYSYIKGTTNVTARTWGYHQCIKYESLSAWIKARAVDIFQEGVLVPADELI